MKTKPQALYDDRFYQSRQLGSIQSAAVIAPLVMDLVRPEKVVDVGCGQGVWLKAFLDCGVREILGIDGNHVSRDQLLIDPSNFVPMDLAQPRKIEKWFDLAMCLEVGEHLPKRSAPNLVRMLTAAAPVVLFSAALPGQGGIHHINERWPSWWRQLFIDCGFERLDPIRRRIWFDKRVEWWYRQNVYLYASREALASSPKLQAEYQEGQEQLLELVHQTILEQDDSFCSSCRKALSAGWRAARRLWNRKPRPG